jgi:hypothetical protein
MTRMFEYANGNARHAPISHSVNGACHPQECCRIADISVGMLHSDRSDCGWAASTDFSVDVEPN